MIKNLYLHIGSHKTGTSSIQLFLKKNAKRILKNESVLYFRPEPWPLIAINNRPEYKVDLSGLDVLKTMGAEKAIISHETFSWINSVKDMRKLHDKFVECAESAYVVVYLRRQDLLAVSQKQEGTKWLDNSIAYGHEISALPSKLSDLAKNYLDFETRLNKWRDVFGRDRMIIRIFENDRLHKNDSVPDFLKSIGIEQLKNYESVEKINESLSRLKQIFLHETHQYFPEKGVEKRRLIEAFKAVQVQDSEKLLPSRQEALSFYEQFREGNKRLNMDFQLTENEYLFSDDFSSYPETSNARGLTSEEINFFYSSIIKEMINQMEVLRESTEFSSSKKVARSLKNLAIKIEDRDLLTSKMIMEQAKKLNPSGPLINKKIKSYQKLLSGENGI